jgi:UDP-N-acetylmuramoylalanine--D-glutamate ligase
VLNADDPVCVEFGKRTKSQVVWFSRKQDVKIGASVRNGRILFRKGKEEIEVMPVSEIPLKGSHNLENVLAAGCSGLLLGCEPSQVRKAITGFKAVEHRLEYVATVEGVDYYNDSKATNVDATIKALESFPGGIHLILGGKDKGSDYTLLNHLLRARVKRVYTIGAAAAKIESQVKGNAELVRAETLQRAVEAASESAVSGDVVLLAPACASFDQFENYGHRGRVFKELVQAIAVPTK